MLTTCGLTRGRFPDAVSLPCIGCETGRRLARLSVGNAAGGRNPETGMIGAGGRGPGLNLIGKLCKRDPIFPPLLHHNRHQPAHLAQGPRGKGHHLVVEEFWRAVIARVNQRLDVDKARRRQVTAPVAALR